MFEVLEDALAVSLDTLYVAEEGVALGLEDVSSELTSWRGGGGRGIEGVKHGDTVRFAEWFKTHLVDQGLNSVSVGVGYDSWLRCDYPATNANVCLSIQLLHLPLLLLHGLYPF